MPLHHVYLRPTPIGGSCEGSAQCGIYVTQATGCPPIWACSLRLLDRLLQLLDRLPDALQAGFLAQHFERFEERWRVLAAAHGDTDRLEHLSGLDTELFGGT